MPPIAPEDFVEFNKQKIKEKQKAKKDTDLLIQKDLEKNEKAEKKRKRDEKDLKE